MPDQEDTVTLEEWINAACNNVVRAMQAGTQEHQTALARSIADVEEQLPAELDDLAAFLRSLQRLLAGTPPEEAADQFSAWYAEVFDRVVEAGEEPLDQADGHAEHVHQHPHPPAPDGQRMGLGEVLEEIVQDALRVMQQGTPEERARMAQGLELLRLQARQAMEWPAFAEFLEAVQNLLREAPVEQTDFEPPFDQAWTQLQDQQVGYDAR